MTFTDEERQTLAALADVLIPAGNGFPSASEAGVARDGLDYVLNCRPELLAGLKRLLEAAKEQSPHAFVEQLRKEDEANFAILADLVPGAYFLNTDVRDKLGYRGQIAKPIDPEPDYLRDALLQSVINRGPIYRPTPR